MLQPVRHGDVLTIGREGRTGREPEGARLAAAAAAADIAVAAARLCLDRCAASHMIPDPHAQSLTVSKIALHAAQ
jgi:hypothetical protein